MRRYQVSLSGGVVWVAMMVLVLTVGPPPAFGRGRPDTKGKEHKTVVCHKGMEIKVDKNAVNAHLDHGDLFGSCDPVIEPEVDPVVIAADAGPDVTVVTGDVVDVTGAATVVSGDVSEDDIVFVWTQVGGDPVTYTSASPPLSVDTFGGVGDLTFRLTATAPDGTSGSDDFTITATEPLCDPTFTEFGFLAGQTASYAVAVNASGNIAGESGKALVSDATGALTDLGTFGGTASRAFDLNDDGLAVGQAKIGGAGQWHAFFWDGMLRDLTLPSQCIGCNSASLAINTAASVAGWTEFHPTSSDLAQIHQFRATIWNGTSFLEHIDIGGYINTAAVGINNAGDVALAASNTHPYNTMKDGDAYVRRAGAIMPVDRLSGYSRLRLTAMTDAGFAVGYAGDGSVGYRAVYWDNGTTFDLGEGLAYGGNSLGDVVGQSAGSATLWRAGTAIDLNSLLPVGSGWTLLDARDINDADVVVGYGTLNGLTQAFSMVVCP